MIAVNYSTARRSFKDYCDKVVDSDLPGNRTIDRMLA